MTIEEKLRVMLAHFNVSAWSASMCRSDLKALGVVEFRVEIICRQVGMGQFEAAYRGMATVSDYLRTYRWGLCTDGDIDHLAQLIKMSEALENACYHAWQDEP